MNPIFTLKHFCFKILKRLARNYVPRVVIFLIDVCISILSAQFTFFLISSVGEKKLKFIHLNWEFASLVIIQILFFIIFKSYAGVVRYTGFKDSIKQLQTTIATVVTLIIINELIYNIYQTKILVNGGAIIYGFIAFSMLFLFRVIVKRVYQLIHAEYTSTKAYILGTSLTDVAIAESIISDSRTNFEIVGFISEISKLKRTRILTLPIVTFEQLEHKKIRGGTSVIVSSQKLRELATADSDILSQLLELNLKIYKLPDLQDWSGESISSEIKKVNLEDLLQRTPIKLQREKLSTIYKDKVILVTGAAGSIGSDIVRQLIRFKPKTILMLDQAETPLHHMSLELESQYPNLHFEKIIANVRNFKRLESIFDYFQPEIVFHGAAYKHVPMMEANPIEALDVNFIGTKNLTDLSVQFKISRFVFVSTDKAVNPTNIMGASKRCAEIYLQSVARAKTSNTRFITTRFGNVLGSNGSVIPHFKAQIENLGPVTVTHPDITRYFMTIDEACQLVLEAGAMGNGGEIYVFDMGKPVKIIDLAKQMIRLSGFIPYEDIDIVYTGLRPGEKLYEELLADKENTLPTHHQKILIAKASYNFDSEKLILLKNLQNQISNNNVVKSIDVLKKLVPEFIPLTEKERQKNAI
ncbi:polysaccharide biosynthesis protein [Psychroflexus sediminis]|uniref:NDP-sugar epimerase, includes UDP-GlcNAc-inverting 4,6-dehydratase FlaA1 and capsular polysaccharide biosynthesis protein EpsC n=1 Tax=Psychroflexus sediminis TaxID=470826 RepID=A0A1G7UEF8_9FLAO|nr:nucleoside-diphosphate sugar epimerase/dehydratase [Psychroflexus sediminis]SDG45671.1 NDP-sugar epimerase, includes UDP-GlcNAc-inverting 4,6-dehydratase FlaA1 and capsular polysaccharide biosynthesis protein EpsC [Psychroflexus sediminis]